MRLSSALVLLLAGSASAFTALPLGRAQSHGSSNTIISSPSMSAVAAEPVNGVATTPSQTPNLNIRLNVNEKARTVTSTCTSGTLCTVSGHDGIEGAPFGSYVDYILDDDGNPVFLMNEMSMHTVNIRDNALSSTSSDDNDNDNDKTQKSSFSNMVTLFTQLAGGSGGQDVSRCSLTGMVQKIDPSTAEDIDILRMRYSIAHVYADQVMDSPKFNFYRLSPNKIYFVGGFGVLAKWVNPDDYKTSTPDILAQEAPDICLRVNRDHGEDLKLTATHLLGAEDIQKVRVTSVDRLGMDIRVTSQKGARRNKLQTDEFRVGFRIPVISNEDAKSEILKVFQEAWEIGNGYTWDDDEDLPSDEIPIAKIAEDSLE